MVHLRQRFDGIRNTRQLYLKSNYAEYLGNYFDIFEKRLNTLVRHVDEYDPKILFALSEEFQNLTQQLAELDKEFSRDQ